MAGSGVTSGRCRLPKKNVFPRKKRLLLNGRMEKFFKTKDRGWRTLTGSKHFRQPVSDERGKKKDTA